ncbi:MAG: hypothetical protein RXO36_05145 [Candidatus Nanopusillus acidilobi]
MRLAKDFKKAIDVIAKTYEYKVEYENDVPVFVKENKENGSYERIPYMLEVNGKVYKWPNIVVSKRMFLSLKKFYIEIVPNSYNPLTKVQLRFWRNKLVSIKFTREREPALTKEEKDLLVKYFANLPYKIDITFSRSGSIIADGYGNKVHILTKNSIRDLAYIIDKNIYALQQRKGETA